MIGVEEFFNDRENVFGMDRNRPLLLLHKPFIFFVQFGKIMAARAVRGG